SAWIQIFPKLNVWRNEFKTAAKINVLTNGSARVASLAMGFFVAGNSFGLMIGEICGKSVGLAANLLHGLRKEWPAMIAQLTVSSMRNVLKEYRRYPYFVLTGGYVAALS